MRAPSVANSAPDANTKLTAPRVEGRPVRGTSAAGWKSSWTKNVTSTPDSSSSAPVIRKLER